MALSRGGKIVLGCAVALVLVVGGIGVAIFGVAWWGVNKVKQAAERFDGDQKKVEANLQRANAHTFVEPADGVIAEDRLMRFIAVRKRMYAVYLEHKDMLEAQAKKKDPDLAAVAQLPGIILDLRAAKAEGLAEQGMSESEFGWMFGSVYHNLVLAGIANDADPNGRSVAETVRAASAEALEQAEAAARAAESNPSVSEDVKRQLREAVEQAREQTEHGEEVTRKLEVPPANMVLFKKHKDDILQYTMGGLELLSL